MPQRATPGCGAKMELRHVMEGGSTTKKVLAGLIGAAAREACAARTDGGPFRGTVLGPGLEDRGGVVRSEGGIRGERLPNSSPRHGSEG